MILKRMKRRHLREEAIEFCQRVSKARPEMVYGADIIAGFPTETEEMFENSLKLVEDCDLTWLHVFPYSEREGTPAAKIPNKVPKAVRKERAGRLRDLGQRQEQKLFERSLGKDAMVLIEREREDGTAHGHSEQFIPVTVANGGKAGDMVPVKLTGIDGGCMVGTAITT
jgi:threonylcarbamoyladenosine tRNA methylthiotransferase MtaB